MAASVREKVEYPNRFIDSEALGGQVSDIRGVLLAKLQTNPPSLAVSCCIAPSLML